MTTIGAALSLVDSLGPASVRHAPSVASGDSGFDAVFARVLEQPEQLERLSTSSSTEVERPRSDERYGDGDGAGAGRSVDTAADAATEVGADPSTTGPVDPTDPTDPTDDASDTARRAEDEAAQPIAVPVAQPPAATQVPAPGLQALPSLTGADAAAAVPGADGAAAAAVVPGAPVGPVTAPAPDAAAAAAAVQAGPVVPADAAAAQPTTEQGATEAFTGAADAASAVLAEQLQAGAAEGQGSGSSDTPREGAPQASAPIVSSGEATGATADAAGAPPAPVDAGAAPVTADAAGAPAAPVADVRPGAATVSASSSTSSAAAGADPTAQPDPLAQPGLAGTRVRDRFVGNGLGGTMTVDLSDEGLGPLSLRAHQSGSGLHVTLAAGESATRELLLSQSMQLRSELESVGPVGSLDVTDSLSGGGGGRGAAGDGRAGWADDRSAQPDQRLRNDAPATDAALRPTPSDRRSVPVPSAGSTGLDLLI